MRIRLQNGGLQDRFQIDSGTLELFWLPRLSYAKSRPGRDFTMFGGTDGKKSLIGWFSWKK